MGSIFDRYHQLLEFLVLHRRQHFLRMFHLLRWFGYQYIDLERRCHHLVLYSLGIIRTCSLLQRILNGLSSLLGQQAQHSFFA